MATVPDYQQESPNQQSLILECSVCAEQYGPDFNNQPRSLRCGHTFCTSCLMKILSSRGVPCPVCSRLHPLPNPDVMLLPINYAVQDIMKNLSSQGQNSIQEQRAPCGVCNANPATVICVDCDPENHFKFCATCDQDEHNRPFGPAQRHKRFPIDQAPKPPNAFMFCTRHSRVTATFYSESYNEFACNMCQMEEDWPSRTSSFEPILEGVQRMRGKVQKLTKYTNDMTKKLSDSRQNLETIMNSLEPGSMTAKANITRTFSKCVEILQERQRKLLENVEVELRNRSESLKKQHETVVKTNAKYRDAFESLNSLVSKSDVDFLLLYRTSIPEIEKLVKSEDKSLLRPSVNQDIPFYISKDVERSLRTLGAVGGGFSPIDLDYSACGTRGTLLELQWQLPEGCGTLNRFQVEYEQIQDSSRQGSGLVDVASGDMCYVQSDPQFYEVPGTELNAYVDYLCPSYSYRFRIRSANDAGFGMWSDPIVGMCADFPYTLEYTKRIHRMIIPSSGYYRITVKGARAHDGMIHRGGRGAIISATFSFKAGNVLIMLVGGMSSRHHYHSGGGGGSFVALNEITQDSLLIAAGGGGGTRGADANDFDGSDANIYEDGYDGLGSDFGKGGKNGGPGEDARDTKNFDGPSWGCGGAGFMQDSLTALSFVAGGHAGQNGGFGGGGAVGMYGGGGGGGYSGGGGGRGGGGGGSYVISTATEVSREVGSDGHGSIYIEKVVPPYPASNTFLSRTVSSSTGNGSTTQLNEKAGNLDATASSTSLSTKVTVGSTNGSSGFNIIPETDIDSFHQSPASTSQVMDQPDDMSAAVFTIDVDDVDLEPLTRQTYVEPSTLIATELTNAAPQTGMVLYNTVATTAATNAAVRTVSPPSTTVMNVVKTTSPPLTTHNTTTLPVTNSTTVLDPSPLDGSQQQQLIIEQQIQRLLQQQLECVPQLGEPLPPQQLECVPQLGEPLPPQQSHLPPSTLAAVTNVVNATTSAPVMVNESFTVTPDHKVGTGNTAGLDTTSIPKVKDTIQTIEQQTTAVTPGKQPVVRPQLLDSTAVWVAQQPFLGSQQQQQLQQEIRRLQKQLDELQLQAQQSVPQQGAAAPARPSDGNLQLVGQVQQVVSHGRQNVSPPLVPQLVQQPNVSPPQTQHQGDQPPRAQVVQQIGRQTISPPVPQGQPSQVGEVRPHNSPPTTQHHQTLTQPTDTNAQK